MRSALRICAPWVVTLAILTFLFSRVPAADVLAAARQAAPWTLPALVGLVLCVYLADSFALWRTFGWFVAPLSYRDTLNLRGAAYVFSLLNYALGQGSFVWFLTQSHGVPALRAAGGVLLIMVANLLLLLLLSAAGGAVGGTTLPEIRGVVLAAFAGLPLYTGVLAWRPRWLAHRPVLDVLLAAGVRGHLKAIAARLPHVGALLLLSYTALRGFGVDVPVAQALVHLPIVYFVAVLPISVQGLGPTQGAMIYFFSEWAPGGPAERAATVFAASLGAQAVAWSVQVAIGVACLRSGLVRAIRRSRSQAAAGEVGDVTAP